MKIKKFEEFKTDFNKQLNKIEHKKPLLDNEIKEIDFYIRNETISKPIGGDYKSSFKPGPMQSSNSFNVFEFHEYIRERYYFSEAFLKYMYDGDKITYEDTEHPFYENRLFSIEQALEFADYYIWLIDIVDRKLYREDIEVSKTNLSGLNHKQKLLVLYYGGFTIDLNINTQTSYAKLFSDITNMNFQNTRDFIPYLITGKNDVRTLKNLDKIKKYFISLKLHNEANKVQLDIDELKL